MQSFLTCLKSTFAEVFCIWNKYLIYNLVSRNLKLKYRQSFLGILWTLLVPAASALTYWAVFKHVMKVQISNYSLFIFSGVMTWTFFSSALMGGMESIVGNHGLLNKIPISPIVFPLSETITAFINFLFAIPVLGVIAFLTGAPLSWAYTELFLLWLLLFFQTYGLAVATGVLFVYFRDLRHVLTLVLQIWFYLTPIVYSLEMLPPDFTGPLLRFNPVAQIFHGVHLNLLEGRFLSPNEFLTSIIWTLGIFLFPILIYKKFSGVLVERI